MEYLRLIITLSFLCNLIDSLYAFFHNFESYSNYLKAKKIAWIHMLINGALSIIYQIF